MLLFRFYNNILYHLLKIKSERSFFMNTTQSIPRSEYPRPQFVRESYINLNGTAWTFEFDHGKSGMERKLHESKGFDSVINVPFCPESELSGVQHTDFIDEMYYHRELNIPAEWKNKKILLHFGAVDYECWGFINGQEVGHHVGGSCSFCFDLTDAVKAGETCHFVLRVIDNTRSAVQMVGKQCYHYYSKACSYTRTTGIWQTVWMEAVDHHALKYCAITPDLDNGAFHFKPELFADKKNLKLKVRVLADGKETGCKEINAVSGMNITIALDTIRTWSPDNPFLYDIEYTLSDGDTVIDRVTSYAGLRKIHIEGNQFYLNNEKFYFRLVLDQGFYPDGIWTAPTDEALKKDIEYSMAAGFNGARLHQKVFEERFHYWADKLGYITWGETPSWGASCFSVYLLNCDISKFWEAATLFTREWQDCIRRDYNHPSIVTWTPANETWPGERPEQWARYATFMESLYDLTKQLDPIRPCNDTSGYHHVKTDLWTVHTYRNNPEDLRKDLSGRDDFPVHFANNLEKKAYKGQPYICDEFGGFKYLPEGIAKENKYGSWGYSTVSSEEDYLALLEKEIDVLLTLEGLSGYCYTQLTDIEQEQNGVLTYDRIPKVDLKKLHAIFGKKPQ